MYWIEVTLNDTKRKVLVNIERVTAIVTAPKNEDANAGLYAEHDEFYVLETLEQIKEMMQL